MDSGKEIASGFVVTSGNSAELLELEEEVLDEVSVFVAFGVIAARGKTG